MQSCKLTKLIKTVRVKLTHLTIISYVVYCHCAFLPHGAICTEHDHVSTVGEATSSHCRLCG